MQNAERETLNAERPALNAKSTTANRQLPTANSFTIHHSPFTLQAGAGASSKNFKKAVDRNRIKRLTRETYRLQKNDLQNLVKEKNDQLALFFIYTGKELPEYKIVFEKMGLILQKLIKIISESNPENT